MINRLFSHAGYGVGILGHPLRSASEIDIEVLRSIRDTGATVVGVRATAAEREAAKSWTGELRARLEEVGLRCAQLVSEHSLLIADREADRRRSVRAVAAGIPMAAALGAETLLIAPGGYSSVGPWWYHPANFSAEARRALLRSVHELASVAEECRVVLALEGYRNSTISSPDVMAWLLSEVRSPALCANLDYVNFIAPSQVSGFGAYLDELVCLFDERIATIHAKDCVIADHLSAHIDEVPPYHGLLDMDTAVRLAKQLDVPLLLEHLEEYDDAARYLAEFAVRAATALEFDR